MSLSPIYSINFQVQANQNPLSDSGAWQTVGVNGLQILSGVCTGTAAGSAFGEATLNGPTLPQDQYAQFTLGTLSGGGPPAIFLWIRANGTNAGASDGYRQLVLNQNAGSWSVRTHTSGSPVVLGSGTTTLNSGDVFTLEAQGNNVILIQNSTTLFSTTDTTVSAFTNQTLELNAPFGGDVATILTYAAGGFSTAPSAYSVPDDRNFGQFPNTAINVQGTQTYTVPAHPSVTPPVDSRAAGAPVDSRVAAIIPQNSRTPGTYGPGE